MANNAVFDESFKFILSDCRCPHLLSLCELGTFLLVTTKTDTISYVYFKWSQVALWPPVAPYTYINNVQFLLTYAICRVYLLKKDSVILRSFTRSPVQSLEPGVGRRKQTKKYFRLLLIINITLLELDTEQTRQQGKKKKTKQHRFVLSTTCLLLQLRQFLDIPLLSLQLLWYLMQLEQEHTVKQIWEGALSLKLFASLFKTQFLS